MAFLVISINEGLNAIAKLGGLESDATYIAVWSFEKDTTSTVHTSLDDVSSQALTLHQNQNRPTPFSLSVCLPAGFVTPCRILLSPLFFIKSLSLGVVCFFDAFPIPTTLMGVVDWP